MTISSPDWNRLIEAIKEVGIYAGLAYSELKGDNIYMSQTLISPLGDTLAHRHKLRPSGSERWFFTDGSIDGLKTVATTQHGRIGMLECGELVYILHVIY